MYKLSDYDFEFDKLSIAQYPCEPADMCKMLYSTVYNYNKIEIKDETFINISNIIKDDTEIIFNDSKVIKSRILINNMSIINNQWKEISISKWEIFFLNLINENVFNWLVKPWKKLNIWTKIYLSWKLLFEIIGISNEWRYIKCYCDIFSLMEEIWLMPIPPYIKYQNSKENPYQPIIAKNLWSVASPTASLHFTERVLTNLKKKNINTNFITLHIWLWTFKKVDTENIKNYDIHSESIEIELSTFKKIYNIKNNNKKILAVWTTATRCLESLPYLYTHIKNSETIIEKQVCQYWDNLSKNINENDKKIIQNIHLIWNKIQFETKLYIIPWFEFKIIDSLLTNFHLPKSSLLMLVAAFMWYNNMKECYKHALKKDYKFFSFWDCMLIEK